MSIFATSLKKHPNYGSMDQKKQISSEDEKVQKVVQQQPKKETRTTIVIFYSRGGFAVSSKID